MATMNPVLCLRQAFRSMGASEPLSDAAADEVAEEAADAISEYGYSRRESDLRFERIVAEMHKDMAEFKTQVILAIMVATGLIIASTAAAVSILIAVLD